MFTNLFHWKTSLLCAALAGVIFSVNSWLRIGFHADILIRELAFGFLYVIILWWFNLVGYTRVEARFFPKIDRWWSRIWRVATTFFFSSIVIWLDEWAQFLHPDLNLSGYVLPEFANEFRAIITAAVILLIFFFLDITKRFYQTKMENERLKSETSEARFEVLKQQVSPHFLFNSLNILKTMVKANDPMSEEYVVRLSDLYRNLLLSHQKERVPLTEELSTLDNYLFMLKARFDDKLVVQNDLKSVTHPYWLPPLVLQMLVENCIKHNVASKEHPLHIHLLEQKDWIIVQNSLLPKRSVESSTGMGLENIGQRCHALSGKNIEVEKTATHFIVRLPKIG